MRRGSTLARRQEGVRSWVQVLSPLCAPSSVERMNPTRVAAVLGVVLLLAGVAIAFRGALHLPARAAPPQPDDVAVVEGADGEDVVKRALRLAAIDSTKKSEWVESVPGIDDSRLTARQRETFIRFANAERCTCDCGFTLAACRAFDSSCEVSLPRVQALFDSVVAHRLEVPAGLRERPVGH